MTHNGIEERGEAVVNKTEIVENGDETPEYRDRLRTWLIKKINSNTIPGLTWENEEKTVFRMPWKHAGRQDYSLEEDSKIFMAWAKHSGRYRAGVDKPEPIVWKTRLRCALNKMPDIREIPERSRLDISEPYRVYQFLPPVHKDSQIRRRTQRRRSQNASPVMQPKHELSPRDKRGMLSLTYSNGQNTFEDTQRIQTDKANPLMQWYRPLAYNAADSRVQEKISSADHVNPFVDFINSRRVENIGQTDAERHYPSPLKPSDVLNFRPTNGNVNFPGFPNQPHPDLPIPNQPPSIPSMMMSAAGQGLAAYALRHQLGMTPNPTALVSHLTAQAISLEQKYQEQMSYRNKLEDVNEKLRKDEKRLQREISRLQRCNVNIDNIENKEDSLLQKRSDILKSELKMINEVMKQRGCCVEDITTTQNPSEFHGKVEKLEKNLAHYKFVHEREKIEREKLENELNALKNKLRQMGEGLRTMAVNSPEPDENNERSEVNKEHGLKRKSSCSPGSTIWNPLTSTSRQTSRDNDKSIKRSRLSPPLDLTLATTPRKQLVESDSETSVSSNNKFDAENEHVDIETPIHGSNAMTTPHYDIRPMSMTSPCSVSSCNSADFATSPKSPQQILRLFGNNKTASPNIFPIYSTQSHATNGAIHVS